MFEFSDGSVDSVDHTTWGKVWTGDGAFLLGRNYSERYVQIVDSLYPEHSLTRQIVLTAIFDEWVVQLGNHVINPFNGTYDCWSTAVNIIEIYTNSRAGFIDSE